MADELKLRLRAEIAKQRDPTNHNLLNPIGRLLNDALQALSHQTNDGAGVYYTRDDQTHPATGRREGAVRAVLAMGWKWDGEKWQHPSGGAGAEDARDSKARCLVCDGKLGSCPVCHGEAERVRAMSNRESKQ